MRKTYNKLLRDRIPEIMDQAGVRYEVEVVGEVEYRRALLDKLIEEAREVAQAEGEDLIKELADLSEVIDKLLSITGIAQ